MREGHWRWTTARVRSCTALSVEPRGPTSRPRSSPVAAISTVSSSRRRHSTVPSMPNSLRRPTRNARPASPCSSSVIPSAMSTVSFGSELRCGALSADGLAEEPFLEPSRASMPAVADLLRLRRRRAERLVPVPLPVVDGTDPLDPAASPAIRVLRRPRALLRPELPADPVRGAPAGVPPGLPGPPCPRAGCARVGAGLRRGGPAPGRGPRPACGRRARSWARSPRSPRRRRRPRPVGPGPARSPPRRSCPPPLPTPPAIEPFSSASSATADAPWAPASHRHSRHSRPSRWSAASWPPASCRWRWPARWCPSRSCSGAGFSWPPRCHRSRSTS